MLGVNSSRIGLKGFPREPRGRIVVEDDGSLRVDFYPETDFKQMVARLKDYQAAVLRAELDIPTRLPGPSPSLPESYIRALRDEYEHSTGRPPGGA
jgi:hypothetical protein